MSELIPAMPQEPDSLETEREFYLGLLRIPLRDREETILQWVQESDTAKSRSQVEQETLLIRRELTR